MLGVEFCNEFPHGYGQKTLRVWMEAPIKDIGPGPEVAGGGAVLRLLKIQSIVNTNTNKKYMRPYSLIIFQT